MSSGVFRSLSTSYLHVVDEVLQEEDDEHWRETSEGLRLQEEDQSGLQFGDFKVNHRWTTSSQTNEEVSLSMGVFIQL